MGASEKSEATYHPGVGPAEVKLSEDDYTVLCEGCGSLIGYAPEDTHWKAPDGLWCFSCWSDRVDEEEA